MRCNTKDEPPTAKRDNPSVRRHDGETFHCVGRYWRPRWSYKSHKTYRSYGTYRTYRTYGTLFGNYFDFTTFKLNFTSWVVGTLPLNKATAWTTRSLRPPGAAVGGAFSTSVASSLSAGITTSAAVTSLTAAPGTSDTLNSPA